MTFLTFLNELSYLQGPVSQATARDTVRTLISVLKELKKERLDLALHSSIPLNGVPLGDNVWLGSLRSDGETVDDWRFLRGLENRAPFHIGLEHEISQNLDYEFQGKQAVALGFSYEFDALAVSLDSEPWRQSSLVITRFELRDDGTIESENVLVRHASLRDHIEQVRPWLRIVALSEPVDGDDLWENRAKYFPRLRFLARVEAQVRSLKSGMPELLAINRRLWQIQAALGEWDLPTQVLPTFHSKVTPEHEQRRSQFNFEDADGETRCFDLHARYTPGAGRVHFWCDRSDGTAAIGYIGEKVQ
ncbi:hypothetical protein ABID58_007162 [Bradyrhizobium sp. S3.2.6]|uniref:hypothetical protein n=1 Tax=Bradyrhizobium sp. S3.2.6 TaxID=3156428 RepID=UPI003398E0FA